MRGCCCRNTWNGRAADKGEAGITRQSWELLRDLLREAVVEGKRLVRVWLNL